MPDPQDRQPAKLFVIRAWSFLLLASLLYAGCGRGDRLATVEVSGSVTLDGRPLDHGSVTFTPSRGRAATGEIQSDGSFRLTTYNSGDGAIVGTHKIAVVSNAPLPDVGQDPEASVMPVPRKSLIPARYNDYSTSGLTFEVKADGKNLVALELSSRQRE